MIIKIFLTILGILFFSINLFAPRIEQYVNDKTNRVYHIKLIAFVLLWIGFTIFKGLFGSDVSVIMLFIFGVTTAIVASSSRRKVSE